MENEKKNEIEYSCSECNSEVKETDNICPICGADLSDEIVIESDENFKFSSGPKVASQNKRILNLIIDLLLLKIIIGPIFFIILILLMEDLIYSQIYIIDYLFLLLILSVDFFYFIFFEYKFSKTIAKYITKTKVVSMDGGKPKLKAIFIRTLCRYIPFEAFSFLGDNAIGWHDKISKTKVIND